MKKLAIVLLSTIVSFCLASSAFAGSVAQGQMAKCTDAKSIMIENMGGGAIDRGEANASVWFSSTHITSPISLAPNAHMGFPTNDGAASGGDSVKMSNKHSMGRKSVTLVRQNNFSRGDSISDISGEVRITNTGTTNLGVTCN